MRPEVMDIAVPPFSPRLEWLGEEPAPVDRICARGPLLVHFIDVAHFSSVRTLPYLRAWHERYGERGLAVLAVNSPRFPFTADRSKLAAAVARLDLPFPVASDPAYAAWHEYGCQGWPSLFLWGRGGALRWYHFGEGEYEATESAIREELDGDLAAAGLAEAGPSLRPSDATGALVAQPSPEAFPGGSASDPWQAPGDGAALEYDYEGGGAWAAVDGAGTLTLSLDGGAAESMPVDAPGAYELVEHERHERHHLSLHASSGVSVYSVGFSAGVPA
jgi:hypothetical protein